MHSKFEVIMVNEIDLKHLKRCVELAEKALEAGDHPFGSVLVAAGGEVLFEDHNHAVTTGDNTRHPEFEIARWAAANMSPEDREKAVVYTSGEHCAMCSAAHALVGLGRIVYVSSSKQLVEWRKEMGISGALVNPLPIQDVVPNIKVEGPVPELAEQIRKLHLRFYNLSTED